MYFNIFNIYVRKNSNINDIFMLDRKEIVLL